MIRNQENVVISDFDGVLTKLDINWNQLRTLVEEMTDFKITSFTSFWESYYNSQQFNTVSSIVEHVETNRIKTAKINEQAVVVLRSINAPKYISSMQTSLVISSFLSKYNLLNMFKSVYGRDRFGSKRKHYEAIRDENPNSNLIVIDDAAYVKNICKEMGLQFIRYSYEKGYMLDRLKRLAGVTS
jgi:2-hydroxy-3-keto-5-methylthiopentenyl-1-phosphate phosphatase